MEGGDEGCNEGLVVFDKEGLEGKQELVDVGELDDSLPCDLVDVRSGERKGEDTDDEDELETVDKGPLDCIAVLLVSVLCCAALDQGVSDEGVEGRGGRGGGEGGLGGERAGPEHNAAWETSAGERTQRNHGAFVRDGAVVKHTGPRDQSILATCMYNVIY